MAPYIPSLRRACHTYLHSKLVEKLEHEVSIVLFGTSTTDNELNQECEAAGHLGQYLNITTLAPLAPPPFDVVRTLDATLDSCGKGNSHPADFTEGLALGVHILRRGIEQIPDRLKSPKRVILISNFLSPIQDDDSENPVSSVMELIADNMIDKGITLQVVSLDIPADDSASKATKDANCDLLDVLLPKVDHTERSVTHPGDLAGIFPFNEHSVTSTYVATEFEIGATLKIPIKLALKTQREKPPTLGTESPLVRPSRSVPGDEDEGGDKDEGTDIPTGVQRSTDFYRADDEAKENPIEDDEKINAYRVRK